MEMFQLILAFISGCCITLGFFYLFQTLLVHRSLNKYFYFSCLNLSSFFYVLFQLLLSNSQFQEQDYVLFQRLKIFFVTAIAVSYLFMVYDIYFKKSRFPKLFLCFSLFFMGFLPFDFFISKPVNHLHLEKLGISFDYRFAQSHLLYYIYSLFIFSGFLYTSLKIILSKGVPHKKRGFFLTIPFLLSAVIDFSTVHRFIDSILISEFLMIVVIAGVFAVYFSEEQVNYSKLKNLNQILKKMVLDQTKELRKKNAMLHDKNQQLLKDMDMARRVQMCMIPETSMMPHKKNFGFGSKYIPMEQIGGDLYDVIKIDEHRYGLLIADVSGHGVTAALIMSILKMSFNNHSKSGNSITDICRKVNLDIYGFTGDLGYYATACFGIIDTRDGIFEYSSAGHHPILRFNHSSQEDKIQQLKTKGVFLGVFPNTDFVSETITLNEGDKILFYTDGIIEARSANKEFYSYQKLENFIQAFGYLKPKEFVQELINDVERFSEGHPASDDRAVLCVEFVSREHGFSFEGKAFALDTCLQ